MWKPLVVSVLISSIFGSVLSIGDEDITCTSNSCKDVECSAVSEKCSSDNQNAGIYMLSPDVCNCCQYCLVYLAEGEGCSLGDPSNAKHTSLCGPGLTCVVPTEAETDGTCQKMSTACALEQQTYDIKRSNGSLGSMETRATCDDDGLYGTYKCIPGQTCHCLHSNGTRIFGEANYNSISNYMTCACSRAYYDAIDIMGRDLHPHEHFRCTPDGSYDRLQCINEECLCVDSIDGAPTFPEDDLVDLKNIDKKVLSCYNSSKPGQYYKKCEEEYLKVYKEVDEQKTKSGYSLVLGYVYPKCDLDGTYLAVQENKTHKYCVDKEGMLLTTPLDKTNSTLATLITNMDCKCARSNLIMTTKEKPECLDNGNYNPLQCRRGVCRCVDADGNQVCTSKDCDVDERQATLTCT